MSRRFLMPADSYDDATTDRNGEGMTEVITDQTPSRVSGYCSRFSRDLQEQGRLKEAEAGR